MYYINTRRDIHKGEETVKEFFHAEGGLSYYYFLGGKMHIISGVGLEVSHGQGAPWVGFSILPLSTESSLSAWH